MMASGLMTINPPYVLREELSVMMPWLTRTLAQGPGADWRLIELAGE